MLEAVRAFSSGAAMAVGEGGRRGQVAVGQDGDLTVWDGPVATPEEILRGHAALTVVGGRIAWGR